MDWTVAVAAIFLGQVVRGATGFGSALVAVPILTAVWGPVQAVAVVTAIDVVASVFLVPGVRREVDVPLVLSLFIPIFIGQWIGTELLVSLPEVWVRRVLGALVIVFGLDTAIRPVKPGRGEWDQRPEGRLDVLGLGAAAGLVGGVMGGLVGAAGPPIVLYVRRYFVDAFCRAQLIVVFTLGSTSLVAILGARGVMNLGVLQAIGVLLVPMAVGALVGSWLSGRVSRVGFGRFVGALLAATGALLLLS